MVSRVNAPRLVSALVALSTLATLATPDAAPTVAHGAPSVAAGHAVLPFIADDYTRAVAEARARKVPLFIEAWAPW